MSDYEDYLAKDARLVICRELAKQSDGRLNEHIIVSVLEVFGHRRSRDWVLTQLRKLEELGAVRLASIDRPEIEPILVADQAVTVDVAINDFLASLWQAIIIILVCSFVSLGVRPGAVVALSIPLTLAIVFAIMDLVNIDLHRVSLGALIIALTLLVDDAMTTVDAMLRQRGS